MQYGHYGIYSSNGEIDDAILESLSEKVTEIFTTLQAMGDISPLRMYSNLSLSDIHTLSEFFYHTSRPYRRAIKLKTGLLSSSFYLKPNSKLKSLDPINRDYVKWWTKEYINTPKFNQTVSEAIFHYILFNQAYIVIEDNNISLDPDIINKLGFDPNIKPHQHLTLNFNEIPPSENMNEEEKQAYLKEQKEAKQKHLENLKNRADIIKQKIENGERLTKDEIDFYAMYVDFPEFAPDYKGIINSSIISPRDIVSKKRMPHLGYIEIEINLYPEIENTMQLVDDKHLDLINTTEIYKKYYQVLTNIGYSPAITLKHILAKIDGKRTISINNNPKIKDGIIVHEMIDNTSKVPPILSILEDLKNHFNSKIKIRDLILEPSKYLTFVVAKSDMNEDDINPDMEQEDISTIETAISTALNDDGKDSTTTGAYCVINRPVEVIETRFSPIQEIKEPKEVIEDAEEAIYQAFDIPASILSGSNDESYGSGYLKAELLNNEMSSQADDISSKITQLIDYIFKVKGFVAQGFFGQKQSITPTVAFDVGAIKDSSEHLDKLGDLKDNDMISTTTYLDAMGIDPVEEKELIKEEQEDDE